MAYARSRIASFAARALLAIACVLPAAQSLAQVQSVVIKKNIEYTQTSATAVSPSPVSNGYGFGADVNGVNIGSIPVPTLTGPINTAALGPGHNGGKLVYAPGDNGWRWGVNANDFGTSSLANLNSIFGSGTYTITVNGTPVSLNLAGDAHPNAPQLTLSGGNWANDKYVIDPSKPLTITTNAFTGYGSHTDDLICVGAVGPGYPLPFAEISPYGCAWIPLGKYQFHSAVPGSNTLTYTVPANTFVAGQEYLVVGAFSAIVDLRPNAALPGSVNAALYEASTLVRVKAEAPAFPMTVTTNITPTTSSATATVPYWSQGAATTGNVYTLAVAPATIVQPAAAKSAMEKDVLPPLGYAKRADGSKDTSVACVLAQLNGSGQLQAVSVSSLQAYVSGVLSSQGQAVQVLNGVATANIAGSTFYVGFGSSSTAMLSGGVNRSVVTVPGSLTCQPQPPQTGWWWNAAEDGRGYTIESTGSKIFFAAYLYDVSGRSTWYIAAGPTSLDGSLFVGNLESYSNGQTLTGAFRSPVRPPVLNGQVTLAFNDSTHGTMVWPGGTVPITRMEFGVGGVNAVPQSNQPENGWWLSGLDDGRGFFIEWQAGVAFMAGFMYDDTGAPVWYIAAKPRTDNAQAFSSNWEKYVNGQTLTGAYRPPVRPPTLMGAATIQFQGAETAIMTMPGGRQVNLSRYRF